MNESFEGRGNHFKEKFLFVVSVKRFSSHPYSLMVAVRIMSGLRASCRYILVRASVCEMEKLRSFAQLLLDIGPHTTWLMNALKEFRKTVYLSGHFKADIFKKKSKSIFKANIYLFCRARVCMPSFPLLHAGSWDKATAGLVANTFAS